MVFPDVCWPLASAHIEDWDTKRLFGRLLGWAAMAIVGDLEVGREKRARCSVNLNFIPLGFSYMLVVSLSSSVPTSVLPSWENKPLVYCGGEGKKSRDWAEGQREPQDLTVPPTETFTQSSCFGPTSTPVCTGPCSSASGEFWHVNWLTSWFSLLSSAFCSKIVFQLFLPLFLSLVICTLNKLLLWIF